MQLRKEIGTLGAPESLSGLPLFVHDINIAIATTHYHSHVIIENSHSFIIARDLTERIQKQDL